MDVDLSSPSSKYVRNLHTSLIFRLPQEIISEIFYFVRAFVNSLGYDQRPVPSWIVSTSHVSSRLRHIAINESPFLWIYIRASNMEQAEVFARRAKNAPLNFRLSMPQVLPAELESINSFLYRHLFRVFLFNIPRFSPFININNNNRVTVLPTVILSNCLFFANAHCVLMLGRFMIFSTS
ncbi:hypothetical protein C8Q75DRAFT_598960 [Abortiporus biennis]|nr:hypothetical protein C8Q75DRAFT_598960 [Abortiporus biennis]